MKLNETTLSFLEVDCIQQFGKEKGNLIFEQVEKIFQELLNNADYRNNAAIQNHLQSYHMRNFLNRIIRIRNQKTASLADPEFFYVLSWRDAVFFVKFFAHIKFR